MFERIRLDIFLVAFCIGIGIVYVFSPAPQMVYKFPSPQNAGTIKYVNKQDASCYKYASEKVPCTDPPPDTVLVDQPVLENFGAIH